MTDEKTMGEESLEMEDDVIQLVNEDGETLDFFHVATLEHKGEWFVFFQPAEPMEDIDEDELAVFKLEEDENGDDAFVPVEDEKLIDELYALYESMESEEGGCGCGCSDCGSECGSECGGKKE